MQAISRELFEEMKLNGARQRSASLADQRHKRNWYHAIAELGIPSDEVVGWDHPKRNDVRTRASQLCASRHPGQWASDLDYAEKEMRRYYCVAGE